MYILGINGRPVTVGSRARGHGGNHNSAACLLKDGKLLSFVEEERFTHRKHDGSFPVHAIAYCLTHARIRLRDVDHIAVGWRSFRDTFLERLAHFTRTGLVFRIPSFCAGITWFSFRDWLAGDIQGAFRKAFPKERIPPITFVQHHLAHAASSYYCSGFDGAAVVNFDGAGETTATWLGKGEGGRVETLKEFKLPDSLGFCYSGFTEYLGFLKNNDEYKVMGLASYGKPKENVRDILRVTAKGYSVDRDAIYHFNPIRRRYNYAKLIRRFGPARPDDDAPITQRQKDIAASIQHRLEEAGIALAKDALARTKQRRLCLAGGVALNCKMNKRIREATGADVFVQPAAADMGVALGAALYLSERLGVPARFRMEHVYYGPAFTNKEIEAALRKRKLAYRRVKDIAEEAAARIHKNLVVGWFQGRMEAGPRALGNRSILANPCTPGMDDIVNEKIKFREKWRPFCPSLLDEAKERYFEQACETPFMIMTFDVKKAMRKEIPSVVHVDGTARPQTVRRHVNPKYYALIEAFGKRSGHPIVMNTSFNIKGDTIVNTPDDAIRTFLKTDMDALCIGDFLVEK